MRYQQLVTFYFRFCTKSYISNLSTLSVAVLALQSSSFVTQKASKARHYFANLLQSCIPSKHHIDFRTAQALFTVFGFHSDIFLCNLLLNGYSRSGCLIDARKLFDSMSQTNLISWSSIISAYSHHGNGKDALILFSGFRACCFDSANEFTLPTVLRACAQLKAINQAIQVHALIIKTGFDSNVYVGTALIDVYSKNGYMEEANTVFDELPVKNVFTWTTMITGYSHAGHYKASLYFYDQMRGTGLQTDPYVISSAISACSMLGFLKGGKQIHGYLLRNGAEANVSVSNVLVDLYSKCQKVTIARRIFGRMVTKNVVSWTAIISGCMQNGYDWDAIQLFSEMNQQGLKPDGCTCTSILTSCGSVRALEQGKQVHCYTVKFNLESDDFVKNGLIDMYAKCGSLVDGRNVFDFMIEHNVVSYNAIIEGYARNNELCEALLLFNRMRSRLLHPSPLTFVSLLGISASLSALELCKQIHGLMVKCGISVNLYAGSSLVDVYSKCSLVNDAQLVFDGLEERDIVVWNAMISGYTRNSQGEMAIKLFIELQQAGEKPNEFTYVAAMTSASNLTSLIYGLQLHSQILKVGLDIEPYVSNALIDLYAKCGAIEKARRLFDASSRQDVFCWNSMISTYAQHGLAEDALNMFQRMKYEQIEPNYVTFVAVLSACSHAGLVEEGLNQFNAMKYEFNIEPGTDHYATLVALLGRSGKLKEAKDFIEDMPIEPAAVVWRSLLGSCRLFGDVDLGKHAADMAISIEPKDSGSYILLSNIYASKGMWSAAEKVRRSMDTNSVVKEPGHSWIEMKGEINVFTSKDKAHREVDLIYSVLEKLTDQMAHVGHTPDCTTDILND